MLRFFKCFEDIPRSDDIGVLSVVICQCAVFLDDIGGRVSAVGLRGIVFFQGRDILQQDQMGKACVIFPHCDGALQLL